MRHSRFRFAWIVGSLACLGVALPAAASTPEPDPTFRSAKPLWPEGREQEKNLTVGWRATFRVQGRENVLLRIAASTLYRAFVDGEFLGHGPARGPHGFYRVDEWPLTGRAKPGSHVIAIEVAGYNANSYYLLDQPSFLQAEIVSEGEVLASTGGSGAPFEAGVLKERVQRVQRYSFQRPFSEVYRLEPGFDAWRRDPARSLVPVTCATQPPKALLTRHVPYPDFRVRSPAWTVARGTLRAGDPTAQPWKDRSLTQVGPKLGGFPESELATIPSLELQRWATATSIAIDRPASPNDGISLDTATFQILDFGLNLTGFLGATIHAKSACRLAFTFDEILVRNDVDWKRLGCVNILTCDLAPGTYRFESFEPYTLRFLKLIALEGACELRDLSLRELANPEADRAQFAASDERLNRLFAAGVETFRQNAVDVFMDCPSRERAGWLCDSYFTARVAHDLCGNSTVERNFLQNYLLPPQFAHLPEGMLPMCYPADHHDGVFIPNWALWFVVQLEEYLARSGDRPLVDALRPRVLRLFEFFRPFLNSDGLLERLPSWVFVEWSKANDFVQDVNYPSNMLYARALTAAGRLYDRPELLQQAAQVCNTIRKQSFDGTFFVDNAVRKDGTLAVTRNRTEVGQYFAFFFDVATPESHGELWQKLVRDFGPQRKQTGAFPEVHPANAFIGNQLRLELLSRYNRAQQNLDESVAYQLYMADRTGTLWENDGDYASCNHGFASHAVHVLFRDVLGLALVDAAHQRVRLRFSDLKLDWCQGTIPVPTGRIELRWRRDNDQVLWKASAPAGYAIDVENPSQLRLVRQP